MFRSLIVGWVSCTMLLVTCFVTAQERETKRVPAIGSKVYEQLSRAQDASDAENIDEALRILDKVKGKEGSMNSYERAMMYNFYGFVYYNAEDYGNAIQSFERVVAQDPIPEAFEQTTLFSLAQLSMMQGDFDGVVSHLERWETLHTGPIPAKNYVLKAQAQYQNKQYERAVSNIETAISRHEEDGYLPDESWLILQRAVYYELKQPEKVKEVLAKMIRLYDEPKYWIQLAGMYGELGQEKKQLAMMEVANQMGYVKSGADLFNLAQLYFYHEVPFKGAMVMKDALDSGALDKNLRNLKFYAQCLSAAKETEKAIPVMREAAALSEDGELESQLAMLHYNSEDWQEAIDAGERALEKGGLRNAGNVHLIIGLSLYNQKQYALAINALNEAAGYERSERTAKQWAKFVAKEKENQERLMSDLAV